MPSEIVPLTMSPAKAAAFIGIGKTKMLDLIRAKRIAVKMLDGRIRVSTDACRAFLDSLPDQYIKGQPVRDDEPMVPAKPKAKHGRRKTRH
jgi:hypothetical protein